MTARLQFNQVTIQYPIYNQRSLSLRNHLVRVTTGGRIERDTSNIQIVTALEDATFDIKQGDAVGLIGHNGAGKSTLLRAMAGVYAPEKGTITRLGKIATVIDMGTGMDPELSGYDNIVRMSMLLGSDQKTIAKTIDDIESFTQLGDFLSLPVRTYSMGMTTRLMFAVATSTKPDILLVDEVFGAGDAEFQEKAKERMLALIQSVGIFVFASHDFALVKQCCNRFFFLEHGKIKEIGKDDF